MSAASAVPRLRLRAALAFAVIAALLAVALAWVVIERLDGIVAQRAKDELDRRLERVDVELLLARDALRLGLDEIMQTVGGDVDLLRRLRAGGTQAARAASGLARSHGVEQLWLIDGDGTLIASTWWPERAGLPAPPLPGVDDGGGLKLERPGGRAEAFVAIGSELAVLGESVRAVGAQQLDERLLARVAGADPAELILDGERQPLSKWAGGAGRAVGATSPVGSRAIVAFDGSPLAVVRVWVDDDRWSVARAESRRQALWLGALAALIAGAAGYLVAGRIARPVERLVHAVDQIDTGQADYGFERPAADELDAVAGSFSRTRRELDLQRERSAAAERVAAWREVARRVAHEVKNPLAPIRLTAQNLQRAKQTNPALFDELFDEGMRTVLEEVTQLERLVGEFSEFARLPPPTRTECDPARLLDDLLALHRAEPGLVIERRGAKSVSGVQLDEDQIRRALSNVVGNAIEAMRELEPDAVRRLEADLHEDDGVLTIAIRDTGRGMPDGGVESMFRPYFTTKSAGTGLGLAIVDRIVAEHGGSLAAESAEGGGCRIVIRLPLDAAEATQETSG